jgi:hypothetical protein
VGMRIDWRQQDRLDLVWFFGAVKIAQYIV